MSLEIKREGEFVWRIPRQGPMRTDGIIYASEALMEPGRDDQALTQVANVASLPGIVGPALAMPDFHWGYGFPIGGVAAFDASDGVISPGGVGYDIMCGVRLLTTGLTREEIAPRLKFLADLLFQRIPAGMGAGRRGFRLTDRQLDEVMTAGARWGVREGYGISTDLGRLESDGVIPGADPDSVSERAKKRGADQLGTLGSGNHFVEVDCVEEIYEEVIASRFGLFRGQVAVLIHSGSRGLGHQVCDDFLPVMLKASQRYGIELPDRQLCAAPLASPEGRQYLGAMAAAANFAFCNRQLIAHSVREAFGAVFGSGAGNADIDTLYDIAHNIAKFETHLVRGRERRVCVHRKGATRAFPAGHGEIPEWYREVGQPVLIPGDMGRYSFVMAGLPGSMGETFGSCCHGAGRRLSRTQARKGCKGRDVRRELEAKGIVVRAATLDGIREELPEAYKDVAQVVEVVQGAGLAQKVARLTPLAVIKG